MSAQGLYVVTAQPPTSVSLSLVASFTGPDTANLIVSRCTRFEVYSLDPAGLQLLHDVPIYGRIATMKIWRPAGKTTDHLFISTERYQFCILSYDTFKRELVTEAKGDVSDRIGRPADAGQITLVEPNNRMIGMHLYDGLFKVIPATASGSLQQEAFNIRLEELQVVDIAFLRDIPKPTLALLFQDAKEARHLKTYEVLLKDKDFADGPWPLVDAEAGANMLIPTDGGGILIVGEQSIAYHCGAEFKAIPVPFTCFKAYERLDATRFLLGDHSGGLHVLLLNVDGMHVRGLQLERMGSTSQASTISYITDGLVFVGSAYGDSQLLQMSAEPDESGAFLQQLQRWSNLGPIVDFVVVDLERQGQGQLVTCSGAHHDGSLRVVRNGIGIHEAARIELPGIKGLWSAKVGGLTYLILSFISETRVLATQDEELGEVDAPGFDLDHSTVSCAAVGLSHIVQITPAEVRLIDADSLTMLQTWAPPSDGARLTIAMAAFEGTWLLLAASSKQLYLLDASGGTLRLEAVMRVPHEVSCLALGQPMRPRAAEAMLVDGDVSVSGPMPPVAGVGLWTDVSIRLLSLPSLNEIHCEHLGGAVIPRSIAFAPFAQDQFYLLTALGDGQVISYMMLPADVPLPNEQDRGDRSSSWSQGVTLTEKKVVTLGTKPITLTPFQSHGEYNLFAASDRPAIIHSTSGKLLYSNVNLKDATHMCTFDVDGSSPDTLAIASDDSLIVGTVDEIRKLHIRSHPIGEQPRRLTHAESAHAFAVLTLRVDTSTDGDEHEVGFVRLFDETSFESIGNFQLNQFESPCSILTLSYHDETAQALIVVGTAFAHPDEPEPTSGRLLVFDVSQRSLELVAETQIKGACYALEAFGERGILAGVNNKLQMYTWQPAVPGSSASFRLRAEHCGHILVLYIAVRGDFILVGDLMKSVSLLQYSPASLAIQELARDCSANWMTSVAFLDDDTYLGAENSFNLFVARKNADATTDEERSRLEVTGEFHVGEFINRFRRGSLAMQVGEGGASAITSTLFATVNGVLGVIVPLPADDFALLQKVQTALTRVVHGVGGLTHSAWRSFRNERKTVDATNVIDGDLVEAYLDLTKSQMEQVAQGLPIGVEELTKKIEELARLH